MSDIGFVANTNARYEADTGRVVVFFRCSDPPRVFEFELDMERSLDLYQSHSEAVQKQIGGQPQ